MSVPQPPANVYNAVSPVARQYGVPDQIWETVSYMESGYNPNAVGDQGTSFGLFQLHQGGQLRSDPSRVLGISGAVENATEAMPAIAGAWHKLQITFNPNQLSWWEQFASQSGHPGGSTTDPQTIQASQIMMKDYSLNLSNLGSNTLNDITSNISSIDNVQQSSHTPTDKCSMDNCPAEIAILGGCDTWIKQCQGENLLQAMYENFRNPHYWIKGSVYVFGGFIVLIGFIRLIK